MAYNRYLGNSGRVERVEERAEDVSMPATGAGADPPRFSGETAPMSPPQHPGRRRSPGNGSAPGGGLGGELGRLMRRLSPERLEMEDLLVVTVLYLLYRESGDTEFLVILAGFLFL